MPDPGLPVPEVGAPVVRRSFFHHKWGVAAAAALLTAALGFVPAWFSTEAVRTYGFVLFLGLPFVCGFTATLLYSIPAPRRLGEALGVMTLSLVFLGSGLLVKAIEGLVCLVMAFPLAWLFGAAGVLTAQGLEGLWREWRKSKAALGILLALGLFPAMYGESRLSRPTPSRTVTTTLDVAADPVTVWRHVPACSGLPPPRELVFRLGFGCPVETRMDGSGVGAERACVLSTGVMRERVTVWEPGRRLRFEVLSTPCSMREISFYHGLEPPHVHGCYAMREGEIRLLPLPGGGTRLAGTSRYEQRLWPAAYWMLYSDQVVHSVHRRVFGHIKTLAERDGHTAPALRSMGGREAELFSIERNFLVAPDRPNGLELEITR